MNYDSDENSTHTEIDMSQGCTVDQRASVEQEPADSLTTERGLNVESAPQHSNTADPAVTQNNLVLLGTNNNTTLPAASSSVSSSTTCSQHTDEEIHQQEKLRQQHIQEYITSDVYKGMVNQLKSQHIQEFITSDEYKESTNQLKLENIQEYLTSEEYKDTTKQHLLTTLNTYEEAKVTACIKFLETLEVDCPRFLQELTDDDARNHFAEFCHRHDALPVLVKAFYSHCSRAVTLGHCRSSKAHLCQEAESVPSSNCSTALSQRPIGIQWFRYTSSTNQLTPTSIQDAARSEITYNLVYSYSNELHHNNGIQDPLNLYEQKHYPTQQPPLPVNHVTKVFPNRDLTVYTYNYPRVLSPSSELALYEDATDALIDWPTVIPKLKRCHFAHFVTDYNDARQTIDEGQSYDETWNWITMALDAADLTTLFPGYGTHQEILSNIKPSLLTCYTHLVDLYVKYFSNIIQCVIMIQCYIHGLWITNLLGCQDPSPKSPQVSTLSSHAIIPILYTSPFSNNMPAEDLNGLLAHLPCFNHSLNLQQLRREFLSPVLHFAKHVILTANLQLAIFELTEAYNSIINILGKPLYVIVREYSSNRNFQEPLKLQRSMDFYHSVGGQFGHLAYIALIQARGEIFFRESTSSSYNEDPTNPTVPQPRQASQDPTAHPERHLTHIIDQFLIIRKSLEPFQEEPLYSLNLELRLAPKVQEEIQRRLRKEEYSSEDSNLQPASMNSLTVTPLAPTINSVAIAIPNIEPISEQLDPRQKALNYQAKLKMHNKSSKGPVLPVRNRTPLLHSATDGNMLRQECVATSAEISTSIQVVRCPLTQSLNSNLLCHGSVLSSSTRLITNNCILPTTHTGRTGGELKPRGGRK